MDNLEIPVLLDMQVEQKVKVIDGISRQRKLQLKHKELGLCVQCSNKSYGYNHCSVCREKKNENRRKLSGNKKWVKGSRGRPTIDR